MRTPFFRRVIFTVLLAGGLPLSACALKPPQAGNQQGVSEPALGDRLYSRVPNPYFASIGASNTKLEKDRAAILAMRGDYRVNFQFQETVPLKAGYQLRDAKNTGGFETVMVIEKSPERIVLQHILVTPAGQVIKHWRQDWTFEASERFEFVAEQSWRVSSLPGSTTKGAWTQCVYEVSDAPRYCGTGAWRHHYGVSTWTSDRSWRPLPRREYTQRNDYNALNVENRHTVTANGWSHEQDNTKVVRDGERTQETLVREFGFNDYQAIADFDFLPAQTYWRNTSGYWSLVRAEWQRLLSSGSDVHLNTDVDGMPIIQATFAQAQAADQTSEQQQARSISKLLATWVRVD